MCATPWTAVTVLVLVFPGAASGDNCSTVDLNCLFINGFCKWHHSYWNRIHNTKVGHFAKATNTSNVSKLTSPTVCPLVHTQHCLQFKYRGHLKVYMKHEDRSKRIDIIQPSCQRDGKAVFNIQSESPFKIEIHANKNSSGIIDNIEYRRHPCQHQQHSGCITDKDECYDSTDDDHDDGSAGAGDEHDNEGGCDDDDDVVDVDDNVKEDHDDDGGGVDGGNGDHDDNDNDGGVGGDQDEDDVVNVDSGEVPLGAIIPAALVGFLVLLGVILGLLFYRRRRKRQTKARHAAVKDGHDTDHQGKTTAGDKSTTQGPQPPCLVQADTEAGYSVLSFSSHAQQARTPQVGEPGAASDDLYNHLTSTSGTVTSGIINQSGGDSMGTIDQSGGGNRRPINTTNETRFGINQSEGDNGYTEVDEVSVTRATNSGSGHVTVECSGSVKGETSQEDDYHQLNLGGKKEGSVKVADVDRGGECGLYHSLHAGKGEREGDTYSHVRRDTAKVDVIDGVYSHIGQ